MSNSDVPDVYRVLGDPRVSVQVRTVGSYVPTAAPLTACDGKLVVEKNHSGLGRVLYEGREVRGFTPMQKRLLELLILCKGEVASHAYLLSSLYPDKENPDKRILKSLISQIRKHLDCADEKARYSITNTFGSGYSIRK